MGNRKGKGTERAELEGRGGERKKGNREVDGVEDGKQRENRKGGSKGWGSGMSRNGIGIEARKERGRKCAEGKKGRGGEHWLRDADSQIHTKFLSQQGAPILKLPDWLRSKTILGLSR